ncbi:MAG: 50S ribosomal protein L18 [Candidatus Berkelbacteria bacterium]|nr:50S ribosomal protein L18 [Candidatus Berkelbacteria bacterium]
MLDRKVRTIRRVRSKIHGTADRPRLAVFKSLTKISVQLIDDQKGVTIASAHGKNSEEVGKEIAKKAIAKKITSAVFDRRNKKYHGNIKKLADAARAGGLII